MYFEINHLSELDYVDKATEERYVNPSQKMSPKIVYYVSKIYENFYHYKNGKCRKEIKNHLDIMMQLCANNIDSSLDISFLQFVELHSIPEVKTISKIFNLISNTYQNDKQLCLCILEFLNKEIKASHDALEILECMKKMSGLSCEKIRLIQQQIQKGSNFLRNKEGYVYSKGPLFQFFYLFTNNKENNIRYDSLFVFIKQLDTIYKFRDGPADLRVNLLNNVIKAFEGADMTMSDAYNFAKHLDQDFQMQGYCNSLYGNIKNGKYFRYLRDKNKAKKFIDYFLLPKFKFLAWIAKNYKNQSAFCLKLYDKFKRNIQGTNHTEAYRNLERNENDDLCKIPRHEDLRAQNPINFLEYCKEFIRDILGISPNDDFYNNGVDMDDFFAPAINKRTWTLCLHRSFFNSPYTEAILHFKYWLGIEKVDEELFTACTKYWNDFYVNMKKKNN
ncbi:MAG: hypothetical protein Q8K37_00900 [Alphaproteobacteria bacterium]|nr:hypothetical protein [Alphaproteobacteria bacterium]